MSEIKEVTKGAIPRKYLAHFIDASFGDETAKYVRLGKDLEEFNTEFNAEVETKKNILGETSIKISSYEASDEVEPYYLEADDDLSNKLLEIAHDRKVLDDLKTTVVDVYIWKGANTNSLEAYKEECYIELSTLGGDVNGVQSSFTLHRTGAIEKGTFNLETKTFTPTAAAA